MGQGPRPPWHRQRASHQTLHILFVAHDTCLRNCDLDTHRLGSPVASFIDQFIASLDQGRSTRPIQTYKLYWLVSLAALVACQHYPQKSNWQLPRHSLIRTQMISTIHYFCWRAIYVTLPSLLIYSKTMSQETPALSYFCTNWISTTVCRTLFPCCDCDKNIRSPTVVPNVLFPISNKLKIASEHP